MGDPHLATGYCSSRSADAEECAQPDKRARKWHSDIPARALSCNPQLHEQLAAPLSAEDQTVQSMPDASPTKWHLAHTTWFFETFVLRCMRVTIGHSIRPKVPLQLLLRGGRPTSSAAATRHAFTAGRRGGHGLSPSCLRCNGGFWRAEDHRDLESIVELGLHHEQQHQELILMDAKHMLAQNPLRPVYDGRRQHCGPSQGLPQAWRELEGGLAEIGHDGGALPSTMKGRATAAGSNRSPRVHPVTCGEYLAFIDDGGYRRPELWLSAGWECAVSADGRRRSTGNRTRTAGGSSPWPA